MLKLKYLKILQNKTFGCVISRAISGDPYHSAVSVIPCKLESGPGQVSQPQQQRQCVSVLCDICEILIQT